MDPFDTDAECRAILEELRWPNGVCCLRCGSVSIAIKTRKQLDCNDCRYRFSVTGALGLFKRGLVRSFHQGSHKDLDRYLDEFAFKYNNRKTRSCSEKHSLG